MAQRTLSAREPDASNPESQAGRWPDAKDLNEESHLRRDDAPDATTGDSRNMDVGVFTLRAERTGSFHIPLFTVLLSLGALFAQILEVTLNFLAVACGYTLYALLAFGARCLFSSFPGSSIQGEEDTKTHTRDDAKHSADLDGNILQVRAALAQSRSNQHHNAASLLLELARSLMTRYKQQGSVDDLDEQVSLYEQALDISGDVETRAVALCGLAAALRIRSRARDSVPDTTRALALAQEALALCPPGHSHRALSLDEVGACLRTRFDQSGSDEDLKSAVTMSQEALDLRPAGHPDRAESLVNLSLAKFRYYGSSGNSEDIESSINCSREAMELCPTGHPDRGSILNTLAVGLGRRFDAVGDLKDLAEAIAVLREGLVSCQPGHPLRDNYLGNLPAILLWRYDYSGDADDLDSAVEIQRQSLAVRPAGHRYRRQSLHGLANSLHTRYTEFGNAADLEDAISVMREGIGLIAPGTRLRTSSLNNLAVALRDRFKVSGDAADLDESIALSQEVLALRPKGNPLRMSTLDELAISLRTRYSSRGDADDLERAVNTHREALELCPSDNPWRPVVQAGLGDALHLRFQKLASSEDATEALSLSTGALRILVAGRAGRSECLFRVARLYALRGAPFYDIAAALQFLCDALADSHRNAQLRLTDAQTTLASLGEHAWDNYSRGLLLSAYRQMVRLLPRVAYFGLDIHSRLQVLSQAETLANTAAGHALALLQPDVAVELLEEGRGTFWTQALRLRSAFDDLPPELGHELLTVSRQLEKDSHLLSGSAVDGNGEDESSRRRRQDARFEALLEKARGLPGFARFMLHDTFESLRGVAASGPVVVLVASEVVCQAVVITGPEGSTHQVALDGVTVERLRKLVITVKEENSRAGDVDDESDGRGMKVVGAQDDRSSAVLADLWSFVVKPVIDFLCLRKTSGRDRPRLWWCPTGPFVFLPLHAAGIYNPSRPGAGECLSAYAVSSYTPTLHALLKARHGLAAAAHSKPAVLFAAVPQPPSRPPLPHAVPELAAVRASVSSSALLALPVSEDSLVDPAAGLHVRTLIERLPQASVLHLACHGEQARAGSALSSGFVLQDGTLTLAELMRLHLPRAAFAYLSACESAQGDAAQPDQTMHLAAALMFAGFGSVVGTMWTMSDIDGPVMAAAVYGALFRDGRFNFDDVPYALDDASHALREAGVPPSRWATYVHLGA